MLISLVVLVSTEVFIDKLSGTVVFGVNVVVCPMSFIVGIFAGNFTIASVYIRNEIVSIFQIESLNANEFNLISRNKGSSIT